MMKPMILRKIDKLSKSI